MNVRAERFPLFDSLRAVAALMILTLHAAILGGVMDPGADLQPYIARLDIGVPIFFVISGFLLYRPFAAARLAERDAPSLAGYAWRRFLRIVPAYWVALTVIALVLHLDGVFTLKGAWAYYGFLQMYDSSTVAGGIAQAWTLSVEVSFYVVLPLIALGVRSLGSGRSLRPELWVIGGLSALSLAFNVVAAFGVVDHITYAPVPLLSALPASFFFFGFGMLMAVLSASLEGRDETPAVVRLVDARPWIPWLIALAAFVLVARVGARGGAFNDLSAAHWMARQVLYALAAVGFVLPAVFGETTRGWPRRVLANRVLLYLGLISYGIYLWHLGVMLKLADLGYGDNTLVHPYLHWIVGGFVVTVAIASLSWFVVERPALSLKRLVGGSPRDPAPPGEALAEPARPVVRS